MRVWVLQVQILSGVLSGCGAEGARLLWEQKVVGSIPTTRIGMARVVGRADLRGCLLNTSRLVQLQYDPLQGWSNGGS
jgi:hypothetical protein